MLVSSLSVPLRTVNIELRDVSETRKHAIVTVEATEVSHEEEGLVREIASQVTLPGFRPGKAPAAAVARKYAKHIASELQGKVVQKAYSGLVEEHKLNVVSLVDVKRPEVVAGGQPVTIEMTVDIQPEFETPTYKGLTLHSPPTDVTEPEVEEAVENLRRKYAEFEVATEPAGVGNYVKLSYTGSVDGRPVVEVVPERSVVGAASNTWEEAGSADSMVPGLGAAIVGTKPGDTREVAVEFPAEYMVEALRGKAATYQVEVHEVRVRTVPPLDDAFVARIGSKSVEEIRERARAEIRQGKESQARASLRRQVVEQLAAAVQVPLPESRIEQETQVLLRTFMQENLKRGAKMEDFEARKKELFEGARSAAVDRVKVLMVLSRVAERERIRLTNEDLQRAVVMEAHRERQAPEKFAKELGKDRQRLERLQRDVLLDKALEFVIAQATVTTVSAAAESTPATEGLVSGGAASAT